ncbi:transcription elongation factor B polypeptide 3 [Apis laboriosa]|uniref:transcription elongation factor B polypeptide 3 n=1 Tax=Apis laboriosa TaxID=183418 RepID=UPI001CC42400|nr:transcription elongation factor B polypeptide 3 [Apis laboriosa]XP_043789287.1 transcription elongation factor B polypeptide 3 [Apis laboriosa]XP_043789288.1 transcription elongation factor B polypeptide 3 [Apis laboriosa]XP_043789289.1 transcription elongation factor B polypeptide 3 [Apis laboriosa]
MSVLDKIKHYQRNIEKCDDNEDRVIYCISKLSNLPVTVQHLQETGVGRTVNGLRKYDGGVGNAAKALVAKWKAMVASEETSEGEVEYDDEAYVPDAPDSYNINNRESPKSEENSIRHKSEENQKDMYKHKSEKSEMSHTSHNNKYGSKYESKLKINESQSKMDNDVAKNSNNDLEKQKKYDKIKHSHKHESRSDKKSSKDKSAYKKDEIQSSKHHSHNKSDNTEKHSNKSIDSNSLSRINEENHKKRKNYDSNILKKESKRRKYSDSENDEIKFQVSSSFEKHNNSITLNTIKIKEEPKDKDVLTKNEIKYEKKDSHEKSKSSSSKSRTDSSNSKLKDNNEKHKHKIEIHTNHNKDETKRSDHSKESSELKHHNSSSSDKHHDKSKDRTKKKDHKGEKNRHESKSNKDSKHMKYGSKEPKDLTKIKQEINGDGGIDCHSGASFAEALGMCTMTQVSKKRNNNSPNTSTSKVMKTEQSTTISNKKITVKIEPTSDNLQTPSLLTSNVKLEPLNVDLASTLPEISPNYKPLPYVNPVQRKEEDKLLTDVIYVKNQRTKVYSGNKSGYTSVPTLFELCTRVLIENIDALEFTGGVPFDIIKPVLERATADQLFMLEHYNPYLVEDTDELWQYHCNREFRNKQREEMETWRETYMRCLDEREAKLKTLTANIKQSIDKSVPVRSTKLAYVDNIVKPPRNILKKQAKYGTANSIPTTASNLKKKLISGGGPTAATNISVPPPPISRNTKTLKKTKAPLMAKALQLIKGRYKR